MFTTQISFLDTLLLNYSKFKNEISQANKDKINLLQW